jgi:hypothetical protein
MSNHYHLFLETPEPNLSAGMSQLNGSYAQYFNRKHDRIGHLFQGRFHSVIVDKDNYLLELARYIVLNPVRAGLVENPRLWPWSSFLATVGEAPSPRFLKRDFILTQFSRDPEAGRIAYAEFVMEGIGTEVWHELRGGVLIGSNGFAARLSSLFGKKADQREVPRYQKSAVKTPIDVIFNRGGFPRDELVYTAYAVHGYKLREIGEHLGITPARVSQIVRSRTQG